MIPFTDHYIVIFTNEEINPLRKINLQEWEKNRNVVRRFDADTSWVGKLGEEACHRMLPHFEVITQNFVSVNRDLKNNNLIYEVKTISSKFGLKSTYKFSINRSQFEKNKNDIYIHCFFNLETHELRVVGWNWKDDIQKMGYFTKAGEIMLSGKPAWTDMWEIKYEFLRNLKEMPK